MYLKLLQIRVKIKLLKSQVWWVLRVHFWLACISVYNENPLDSVQHTQVVSRYKQRMLEMSLNIHLLFQGHSLIAKKWQWHVKKDLSLQYPRHQSLSHYATLKWKMNMPGSNSQSEPKTQAWVTSHVWLLTWGSYLNSELQTENRDGNSS